MGKGKRIALIVTCSVALLYLVGGVAASFIVCSAVLDHRGVDSLHHVRTRVYKTRSDFPLLESRSEHSFQSSGNTLKGHYYDIPESKGTVLFAHGMNSCADGQEILVENYFASRGYDVFAFDLTAHGESRGDSMKDLRQSGEDMKSAYAYLKEKSLLNGEIVLSGYSWGGYGSAMASKDLTPDKTVTFAAFDSPYDLMVESAVSYVGGIAYATVPTFALGTWMGRGSKEFEKASSFIPQKTKVFAVQGSKDEKVPLKISFAKAMESKGTTYYNDATHLTPWLSQSSRDYVASLEEEIERVKRASQEEQDAFIATVDKEKSSALDAAMVEKLDAFLSE